MTTRRLLPLAVLALLVPASRLLAGDATGPTPRDGIVLRRAEAAPKAPGAIGTESANAVFSYSVELPEVARLQGAGAFYRTAVDITNHSDNGGVTATVQYSYNCTACTPTGFFRTSTFVIPLAARDSVHFDDMVQEMDDRGLLTAGAVNGSVGGLLVRFDGLPSTIGWEGSAVARLYNRVDENNPGLGTIGYAFPASLFFESAYQTAVGIARDTTPAALAGGVQGSQRTNIGVRNTDVHAPPGSNRPIDARRQLLRPCDRQQGRQRSRGAGHPSGRGAHHRQRLLDRADPAEHLPGPRLRGPDEPGRRAPDREQTSLRRRSRRSSSRSTT